MGFAIERDGERVGERLKDTGVVGEGGEGSWGTVVGERGVVMKRRRAAT